MIRVNGEMRKLSESVLGHREIYRLIQGSMTEAQWQGWEQSHECDYSFSVDGLSRFRVNAFMQSRGASAAFRVVPSRVKTLEELEAEGQVAFKYAGVDGELTAEANPNGSLNNIAGIYNKAGNVLGLMPHPERLISEELGGTDGRRFFDHLVNSIV